MAGNHDQARPLPQRPGGRLGAVLLFAFVGHVAPLTPAGTPVIEHDFEHQRVVLADSNRHLVLRLNTDQRCLLDQVLVGGRDVIHADRGVATAVKLGDRWHTTRAGIPTPRVTVRSNIVTVADIRFGGPDLPVTETWRFTVLDDQILWRIERTYTSAATLQDSSFPAWDFRDVSTWTGGLLGHGGVAWTKLFDAPNASYGVHNGKVTFWHKDQPRCLRILPASPSGAHIAVRFSRQPDNLFSVNYCLSETELAPRHGLSRFARDRQDIWQPFAVSPGSVSAEFALSAPAYDEAYDRGVLPGIDGHAVREICHTIGRIGAVDELIMGSNGYYSDFAVLHEPWLAQLGLPLNDSDYHRAFAATLDFQRLHAIGPDGRVKSRWAGHRGDEMPGTYDAYGYYECQWGWLLDSQTSWVINVVEQFDFSGDRSWLARQKETGESVLDFLLRRDTDGNGLVEMMTDSHRAARGSDWIDVVWAAYENAFVNAQLYWALARWAEVEDLLDDPLQAARYRAAAVQLKGRFNQSIDLGGFWDQRRQSYAYWRERDGSVHGTNLVVPVNFSAIGYGLCDDPARQAAILDQIEQLMEKEHLFFWPLCFFSYRKEEGHPEVNWPFPSYENGDLFLAWGELGTRAYSLYRPDLALKYVKNVLDRYQQDGLAFQRYLRRSQTGAGADILANNASTVVGLYRNLYGLQPKHNRLYLEPHLVPALDGTRLKFQLRGQEYVVALKVNDYAVTVDGFTVRDGKPFGLCAHQDGREYFPGAAPTSALVIQASSGQSFEVDMRSWSAQDPGTRSWSEAGWKAGSMVRHIVSGVAPNAHYRLVHQGVATNLLHSDSSGQLAFEWTFASSAPQDFALQRY